MYEPFNLTVCMCCIYCVQTLFLATFRPSAVQPDRKQNEIKWYELCSLYSLMLPVCCSVSTQLGARILINGTIRLRVTQHFQVSLMDTELNIERHAEEDDPVPSVLKWQHAHAAFVLWGKNIYDIKWKNCILYAEMLWECKISVQHLLYVWVWWKVRELSLHRDQSAPESWKLNEIAPPDPD